MSEELKNNRKYKYRRFNVGEVISHQSNKLTHGITLISLVITIIILIILAGVGINLSLGENGIFRRAKEARDKYLTAEEQEQQQLNELYAELNRGNEPENTPETEAGTRVKVPSGWVTITPNYVNTDEGKIVKKMTISSNVYAVSGGKGVTVPVPEGFYYVGGDIDTGIVISDRKEDGYETTKKDMTSHDDSVKLVGNQFVWIPCNANEYRKITWPGSIIQWDRESRAEGDKQAKKYGGFWIGRYEAGVATLDDTEGEETTFTDSVKFVGNKRLSNGVALQSSIKDNWTWQNYDFIARQDNSTVDTQQNKVTEGNVISKANAVPYYHADYYTAIEMSERMYKENKYVKSTLVTGTQWDMMCKYLRDKGINVEGTGEEDSKWGNYANVSLTNLRGAYAKVNSSGATESFKKIPQSTETNKITSADLKSSYVILTTGSTEQVKKMNIYDISGNLLEWNNEAAYISGVSYSLSSLYNTFVTRGGSFDTNSLESHTTIRSLGCAPNAGTYGGFRVVLCIE